MVKANKYPKMKCSQTIKCPCYIGDGYRYSFDSIEFLFCDECNKKLLNQMVEQAKLEEEMEDIFCKN